MKNIHHGWTHHFTASGVVLEQGHLLLVNHKRIGGWVPPGGHVEPNEMPEETVIREIMEETGIEVEIVSDAMPSSADAEAMFLARPLYVQAVKAVEKGETFYHVDFAYLCRVANRSENIGRLPQPLNNAEVKEARWIKLTELDRLPLAKNVAEMVQLLPPEHLLKTSK